MEVLTKSTVCKNAFYCIGSLFLTYRIYTHLKNNNKFMLYYNYGRKLINKFIGIEDIEELVDYEFFYSENIHCRKHIMNNMACSFPYCSYIKLQKIISYLNSATTSIDLCIYLLTSKEISDALIALHHNGVIVRVIVEEDMSTSSESRIQDLIHAGIEVRSKKLPVLMHHKFCLIDAQTKTRKVLTGSLNWTLQGFAGNSEYIIILNNESVVNEFYEAFNSIWNYFDIKAKQPILKHKKNTRIRHHNR